MYAFEDTIAAPATIPGTGAISIIRISGPDAFAICGRLIRLQHGDLEQLPGGLVRYGTAYSLQGKELDDVIVSTFRNPHSYTGEDSVEISFHASSYVATALMTALLDAGARMAAPGEFTRRAYVNGKMDLAQAEAVADLIASKSEAAHTLAIHQLRGGFSKELEALREKLLDMAALLELELDFSEEDVEFANREQLQSLLALVLDKVRSLSESFRLGQAIAKGVPVAIVGAVNAGKSTLLNALLGDERAIVTDIPGTTRDTIESELVINGILFRLIDTAGLRDTDETVEKIGIARSKKTISEASILLYVADAGATEEEILAPFRDLLAMADSKRQILVFGLNKCDIFGKNPQEWGGNIFVSNINKDVLSIDKQAIVVPFSARGKIGVQAVKNTLAAVIKDQIGESEGTLVSNLRHYEALRKAQESLRAVQEGLDTSRPTDLLALDLRSALTHLASITGMSIDSNDILGHIFARFCIGK